MNGLCQAILHRPATPTQTVSIVARKITQMPIIHANSNIVNHGPRLLQMPIIHVKATINTALSLDREGDIAAYKVRFHLARREKKRIYSCLILSVRNNNELKAGSLAQNRETRDKAASTNNLEAMEASVEHSPANGMQTLNRCPNNKNDERTDEIIDTDEIMQYADHKVVKPGLNYRDGVLLYHFHYGVDRINVQYDNMMIKDRSYDDPKQRNTCVAKLVRKHSSVIF